MRIPKARTAVLDDKLDRGMMDQSQPRDPGMLWLDKNENTDPILGQLTGRILREIDPLTTLAVYPDCAPLYRKLSAYLKVPLDRLVLATGADGVIRSVFEAFCEPGDCVLFPNPTYAMYEVYCRMYGAKTIKVDYETTESGPLLRAEKLIDAIKRGTPKVVCLPNPDSPTGTVFDPDEMTRIIKAASDAGALILVDESYFPYHDRTVLPQTAQYPHLLVIRTFSKAWGMTGLRVGYGVGSRELIALLHKVRPNYEANSIGIAVVERMLDYEGEMLASVRRLNAGRDMFVAEMKMIGFKTFPTHANFLHVNFERHDEAIQHSLKDKVLYRSNFGHPCLRGYSRFTSTTKELFSPLVTCIKAVVNGTNK